MHPKMTNATVRDRLKVDISKMLNEKVNEIFTYFRERMYIENGELPFDLDINLDMAQRELEDKIADILRYQQSVDMEKEEN